MPQRLKGADQRIGLRLLVMIWQGPTTRMTGRRPWISKLVEAGQPCGRERGRITGMFWPGSARAKSAATRQW